MIHHYDMTDKSYCNIMIPTSNHSNFKHCLRYIYSSLKIDSGNVKYFLNCYSKQKKNNFFVLDDRFDDTKLLLSYNFYEIIVFLIFEKRKECTKVVKESSIH